MAQNNISHACVTEFIELEKITYLEYYNQFKEYPNIIPIAYIDCCIDKVEDKLYEIKRIGYKGIKIHIRESNSTFKNPNINLILDLCSQLNLVVFFCTYFYDNSINMIENNFNNLSKLIVSNKKTKIILMHSGAVELLKYMELARFNKNILLDLSFTMCKYEGSSLDLDIKFLFKKFDQRICVGSDFPDFSLETFRNRFIYFAKDISIKKKNNIAYKNLYNFLGN